jgi:hypothetical protein
MERYSALLLTASGTVPPVVQDLPTRDGKPNGGAQGDGSPGDVRSESGRTKESRIERSHPAAGWLFFLSKSLMREPVKERAL